MAALVLMPFAPLSGRAQIMLTKIAILEGTSWTLQAGGSATIWMNFFGSSDIPEGLCPDHPLLRLYIRIVPVFSRNPCLATQ